MGYVSAFIIKDTSGIKISTKLIDLNNIKLVIKKKEDKLSFIENVKDDEITVKEYKALQKEKDDILKKSLVFNISNNFKLTTDNYYFSNFNETETVLLLLDLKSNRLYFQLEEGELFSFVLINDNFVGNGELYSSSNNSWVEQNIIKLIKEFKSSAIIVDMGDEEYGFVYEDGCNRDITPPIVYKNGVIL